MSDSAVKPTRKLKGARRGDHVAYQEVPQASGAVLAPPAPVSPPPPSSSSSSLVHRFLGPDGSTLLANTGIVSLVHLGELLATYMISALIGRVGTVELAAHSITWVIQMYAGLIWSVVLVGIAGRISKALGRDDERYAARLINLSILSGWGFCLAACLIMWLLHQPIYAFFHITSDRPAMLALVSGYFPARLLGLTAFTQGTSVMYVFQAQRRFLAYAIYAVLRELMIILSYYITLHAIGTSLATAGWVVSLAEWVACLIGLAWLYWPSEEKRRNGLYQVLDVDWSELGRFVRDSSFLIAKGFTYLVAALLTSVGAGRLGPVATAAYHIILSVDVFSPYLANAIGVIATVAGGRLLGQARYDDFNALARIIFCACAALGGTLCVLMIILRDVIISSITQDPAVVEQALAAWPVMLVLQIVFALAAGMEGVLYASGSFAWLTGWQGFAFFVAFLPILLIAKTTHSLVTVLLALAMFNTARAVSPTVKAFCFLPGEFKRRSRVASDAQSLL